MRWRWRAEAITLVAAYPGMYFFKITLRCTCGATRTRTYLDDLLILKLALDSIRDPSYQTTALELAKQMVRDREASII